MPELAVLLPGRPPGPRSKKVGPHKSTVPRFKRRLDELWLTFVCGFLSHAGATAPGAEAGAGPEGCSGGAVTLRLEVDELVWPGFFVWLGWDDDDRHDTG